MGRLKLKKSYLVRLRRGGGSVKKSLTNTLNGERRVTKKNKTLKDLIDKIHLYGFFLNKLIYIFF